MMTDCPKSWWLRSGTGAYLEMLSGITVFKRVFCIPAGVASCGLLEMSSSRGRGGDDVFV